MTHTLIALVLIVSLAPSTGFAKAICPEMNRVPHELVTRPTDTNFADPARFIRHGRSPSDALEHFVVAITIRIAAHGSQQARGQDLFGSRQAAKQIVVGMISEQGLDLFAVELKLLAQGAEHLG